jgi:hypothetical protein
LSDGARIDIFRRANHPECVSITLVGSTGVHQLMLRCQKACHWRGSLFKRARR